MPPADVFLLYHPHLLGRVVMLRCAQERRRGAVEARALRLGLGFIRQPGDLQGAVNRLTTDADLAGRFAYAASGSAATCYVSIVDRYSLPVMLLPACVLAVSRVSPLRGKWLTAGRAIDRSHALRIARGGRGGSLSRNGSAPFTRPAPLP
jgi:hypothetical protein